MRCCDVIGYVVDECTLICAECLAEGESDDSPIFADSETDCPSHCERCEALLPEALTVDGQEYVRKAVWDGTGRAEILAEWAAEWPESFPACYWCGERCDNIGQQPRQRTEGGRGVYYCAECWPEVWAADE